MTLRHSGLGCVFFLALGLGSMEVLAHGFAPAYLQLRERRDGRVEALWKVPLSGEGGVEGLERVSVRLPSGCREIARLEPLSVPGALLERFALDCGPSGLRGRTLSLDTTQERGLDVLVSVRFASGARSTSVLRTDSPTITLPGHPGASSWGVAQSYLALGVRHLVTGADHLLFVLGLVLLSRGARSLVGTVTAFTLGHSVTLALSVLGLARVHQAPVEAAIAASILLLAIELTAPPDSPPTWTRRAPWAVAAGFGLLHGFGFAGALREAGLPEGSVPVALLFFNLGVELGQLMFVALSLTALSLLSRLGDARMKNLQSVMVYGMGCVATWWLCARVSWIVGWTLA